VYKRLAMISFLYSAASGEVGEHITLAEGGILLAEIRGGPAFSLRDALVDRYSPFR
jgi:hypothetical protein